jgi:hypothetical protein
MTTPHSGARNVTARFSGPVLRPTRDSVRGLALASVIANAVLVCTGAAVRLSSSRLGCPDWPRCTTTSVVAAHSPLNTAIEFGNRLLTSREHQPLPAAPAGPAPARNLQAPGVTLGAEEGGR